jgi:hypothetical protein
MVPPRSGRCTVRCTVRYMYSALYIGYMHRTFPCKRDVGALYYAVYIHARASCTLMDSCTVILIPLRMHSHAHSWTYAHPCTLIAHSYSYLYACTPRYPQHRHADCGGEGSVLDTPEVSTTAYTIHRTLYTKVLDTPQADRAQD